MSGFSGGKKLDQRLIASSKGLYQKSLEHDSCGVGFIASVRGEKSHKIVKNGLDILDNLEHRGAVGADPLMGDGAGILLQIPDAFFKEELLKKGILLPPAGEYGVGMVFLPKEEGSRLACEKAIERVILEEGQRVIGWRNVPVNDSLPMSPRVQEKRPVIRQIFIGRGSNVFVQDAFERKLFIIRKVSSFDIGKLGLKHGKEFYFSSLSSRTVVYKGLLLSDQVGAYYPDLMKKSFVSALALVHQRFSTNTFPEWPLAQPFRMIAHNGEINTVRGNFNWLKAREGVMASPFFSKDLKKLYPISNIEQSDTAIFDNCLELLVASGYPLAHAIMMMIPEPWEQNEQMEESRRAFYEYHASMMEPWDGPASIVFTDGKQIGATLDRNGLRPSRYCVTDDGLVVMASETGVLPIPESKVIRKWRLQPGKMFLIDLEEGRLIDDDEIKMSISKSRPYRDWIENLRVKLNNINTRKADQKKFNNEIFPSLNQIQRVFGYTKEDIKYLLKPMIDNGQEAIGSMGNDSPLAVLSDRSKPIFNYFKQLFAQVTNPPIDPIREAIVMSLVSFIGPKPNLLDINQTNPPLRIEVMQPILDFEDMSRIVNIEDHTKGKFKSKILDICYPVTWANAGVEAKLSSLCADAVDAVKDGFNILVISDKSVSKDKVAVPSLLALSAIHQHLVREGLRTSTGLVVETGLAREVHHFAVLAGYGAEAIHPYLALETVVELTKKEKTLDSKNAILNYIKAIGKGLSKIMSKMGISTYMSYCGAQIFEAVGINDETIEKYFTGTPSSIGGIGIFELAEEMINLHKKVFNERIEKNSFLEVGGEYEWRTSGEEHMWNPDAIANLQHAVRGNKWTSYQEYAQIINDQSRRKMTLRGLFSFKVDPSKAISLELVEPASEIVKRFSTGAMSLGSISTEAHTTLAVAMNRLGGKSNTGEGGEDKDRYRKNQEHKNKDDYLTLAGRLRTAEIKSDYLLKENDSLRSKIKQVASGRFGVTTEYLSSADQIQIKMAQGAKPGEGGQLPGGKVSEYIGKLRHSVPGVGLISPPPHHDIYSIEDLAQLIHDLKNVSPNSDISVKLVSEIGVGTVAAGVAKGKSDHLVIAGHDGGTGASPLSSIKHAGSPWEIGLAETQQTLVLNGLRSRIRVQVDGQMKTGRDVVIAALLGADEMGFATAPLVAEGCVMMRKCHLNTCPVGIATQNPELRKRFSGKPEHVVNYFFFVAEEARQIMAQLGISRFDDLVGRTDLLSTTDVIDHWKAKGLDFSKLFFLPQSKDEERRQTKKQNHGLDKALDNLLIKKSISALKSKKKIAFSCESKNTNRTLGAMLSGEVIRRYPDGLEDDTINIGLRGTGGQSFGAFLAKGVTLNLVGEANDYTGKGLSGGKIIIRPSSNFIGPASENMIVGNTVLYGATSGEAYFSGVAGERFAVRMSGANAIVEGVGDHGCEYMTGGTVVILGETGRNFAAGMSGGIAYIFDPESRFTSKCNTSMIAIEKILDEVDQSKTISKSIWHRGLTDEYQLKEFIQKHLVFTNSVKAKKILDNWASAKKSFLKVFPHEYKRALSELNRGDLDKKEKLTS